MVRNDVPGDVTMRAVALGIFAKGWHSNRKIKVVREHRGVRRDLKTPTKVSSHSR